MSTALCSQPPVTILTIQLVCLLLQLLDSANRQELSLDMWALSKLRLEPGDRWLDEYFDTTEAQLTRFTLRVGARACCRRHCTTAGGGSHWQLPMVGAWIETLC